MKRWQLILSIFLVITLFVVVLFTTSVTASAANNPAVSASTNPYNTSWGAEGYYYFDDVISNFDSINDFSWDVDRGVLYFRTREITNVSKVGDDLRISYYEPDGSTISTNWLYRSSEGWNYGSFGLGTKSKVFYLTRTFNIDYEFSRLLRYRSSSQSLVVSGTYALNDSIGFDSSVWVYRGAGEFLVNGIIYDQFTIDVSNGLMRCIDNVGGRELRIYLYDNINYTQDINASYLFEFPLIYVSQSVYNNFFNIFEKVSDSADSLEYYQYYDVSRGFALPSLDDMKYNQLYAPGYAVKKDGTEFRFTGISITPLGITLHSGGRNYAFLNDDLSIADDFTGNFRIIESSLPNLLAYLSSSSYLSGGAACFNYYADLGYYRALSDESYYDSVYEDGYNAGYNAGETAGLDIGYNTGVSSITGDFYYYLFDNLSTAALNELTFNKYGYIEIVNPSYTGTDINSAFLKFDSLGLVSGYLAGFRSSNLGYDILYSNGEWLSGNYKLMRVDKGSSDTLIDWCNRYCSVVDSYAYTDFISSWYTVVERNYGYDSGYSEGFKAGASSYDLDLASWFDTAIGGFFSLEIFPGFTLGGILSVIVGISLLMFFLKMFLGG